MVNLAKTTETEWTRMWSIACLHNLAEDYCASSTGACPWVQVSFAARGVQPDRRGQSDHNVGVAVDIVPIVDGRANYKVPESVWNTIGAIGESVGLSWGGRWTSFKDRPHFYDRGGKSIAQLWTEQQNLANLA